VVNFLKPCSTDLSTSEWRHWFLTPSHPFSFLYLRQGLTMYHRLNLNLPFSWGLGLQSCITIPGQILFFFKWGPDIDQLGADTLCKSEVCICIRELDENFWWEPFLYLLPHHFWRAFCLTSSYSELYILSSLSRCPNEALSVFFWVQSHCYHFLTQEPGSYGYNLWLRKLDR
jgi:hypothetical protein